jgi:hypothetical protein
MQYRRWCLGFVPFLKFDAGKRTPAIIKTATWTKDSSLFIILAFVFKRRISLKTTFNYQRCRTPRGPQWTRLPFRNNKSTKTLFQKAKLVNSFRTLQYTPAIEAAEPNVPHRLIFVSIDPFPLAGKDMSKKPLTECGRSTACGSVFLSYPINYPHWSGCVGVKIGILGRTYYHRSGNLLERKNDGTNDYICR